VWGDYDNDGFDDLLLYRWGRQDLFHNDGGKGFTRVSERAGLPAWANVTTATWLDFDNDGRLDLFMGGYYAEGVDLWRIPTTKIMPESFEYADNGGRKYLYRNLGDGRFEEVSAQVGLASTRWSLAAVAADLRGTGYPDLFIANDYGVSELFVNEGGRFREVGRETGVGYAPKSGMSASVGDVFNQGRFAIYVYNISEEGILIQGNNLWVPSGGKTTLPRYENMANDVNVALGGWSFGAQFGDLNNDGAQDLYLVNGYVSASRTESYWYDYSKVAGGHEVVISDAKNWPAMGTRSLAGYQAKRVWINRGAGRFRQPRAARRDRRQPARAAAAVSQRRGARAGVGGLRSRRRLPARDTSRPALHEPQRRRRPGDAALARPAAGAGSPQRLGLLRAEPAAPAFRARPGRGRGPCGHPLAVR
jgi:enediyne biosynthesis protein E4